MAHKSPLVTATATHLVLSQRVVLRLITTMALTGLALGVLGLRAGFAALPADGDRVLTVAIVIAAVLTTVTLFVGLVVIPRRARQEVATRLGS